MITKELFLKTLSEHKKYNNTINKLENVLGINTVESPLIDIPYIWFDRIMEMSFESHALDLVFSYLYDGPTLDKPQSLEIIDGEDTIIIDNDESLWEYLKNYKI